jgi:tetratricopeptide (TPR) repeat protein
MAARRRRGCGRCCLCPREDAGVAAALNNLGTIAGLRGDYERATAWHEAALALRRELGDTWGVAHSLTNLGDVASDQGVYERAATLYEEGLTGLHPIYRTSANSHGCLDRSSSNSAGGR